MSSTKAERASEAIGNMRPWRAGLSPCGCLFDAQGGKGIDEDARVDPKRVSADDNAGKLLVSKAVEAMSREYDPALPSPSISQFATSSPSDKR
jgi:hypothetical protein